MNLAEALLAVAATDPDAVAVVLPERLSYGTLARRAAAVTARVAEIAEPNDRVALVAGNEPVFVWAYLGVLASGGVAVPLNTTSPSREIARELEIVRPAGVVASREQADLARRAVAHLGETVPVIVAGEEEELPSAPVARDDADLAVLLFTAGTAGAPKAAMLTHGSLRANLEQMQSHPGLRLRADDVTLAVLPFFHVYGCNVVLGLTLFAGGALTIVDHFHPAETLDRLRRDGVTVVAAVPAIYSAWCALENASRAAFARVRLCVSGAAPLDEVLVRRFRDRFGVVLRDGYGLTEASPVVTTAAVSVRGRTGSVGPPLPGVEVQLLDRDDRPVLEGDPGEVVVRGANVFAGYWDDPDATASVLRDGWLYTGDIAVADADGWLRLVDRAKDVIIVSGFNVYPGEVEEALADHPDVDSVAVTGERNIRTGEAVVAYVVARAGRTPDPVELLRHAGRRLARYKLPTRVEVVDTLPRTLAGKVLRRALSERASRPPDATTNPA